MWMILKKILQFFLRSAGQQPTLVNSGRALPNVPPPGPSPSTAPAPHTPATNPGLLTNAIVSFCLLFVKETIDWPYWINLIEALSLGRILLSLMFLPVTVLVLVLYPWRAFLSHHNTHQGPSILSCTVLPENSWEKIYHQVLGQQVIHAWLTTTCANLEFVFVTCTLLFTIPDCKRLTE